MLHAPVPRHERARPLAATVLVPAFLLLACAQAVGPAAAAAAPAGAAAAPVAVPTIPGGPAPGAVADPGGGASAVQVERSDDQGLVLALALPDTHWVATAAPDGGAPLWDLRLPGFTGRGAATQPVVPVWGAWIVVPAGTRPVLTPVAEQWETTAPRRLLVGATPVVERDPETGEETLGAELLLRGQSPRVGRALPGQSQWQAMLPAADDAAKAGAAAGLTISEPRPWRGRRIASVTLAPLAADADGRTARVLRSGRWEIRFVAAGGAGARGGAAGAPRSGRGDDRLGFLFLNPEGLRRWPAESAPAVAAAVGAGGRTGLVSTQRHGVLLAPEVQLLVPKTQLYRLTATKLRQLGWLPASGIREDQIRLYQRRYNAADPAHFLEIEVPIRLLGDGGDFSDGEALVFYGLRARDDGPWTDTSGGTPVEVPGCGDPHEALNGPSGAAEPALRTGNVYWLAFADPTPGESWSRMPETALAASSGAPLAGYRRTDYFEEDVGYQEFTLDADSDRNHWNRPRDTAATAVLPVYAPDPLSTTGQVRAGLLGYSISSADRFVTASLRCGSGNVTLGDYNVRNLVEVQASTGQTIAGSLLAGAADTLRVVRTGQEGSQLFAFLDWAELSYDALYHAVGDGLVFPAGDGTGDSDLEVTGFTRADLGVVEITDPHRPAWVALGSANVVDAGGAFTLSLRVPPAATSPRRFVAAADFAGDGVPEFVTFNSRRIVAPADPTQAAGSPDVLVVTHAAFRAGLQRWVDYRQSAAGGGHDLQVVDVQNVYDWFSGGLKDPWAIKRFCSYAMDRWGSWALLLVGDGNENGRALNVLDGSYDWVPTHYHAQYVLNPPECLAADKWFATPAAGGYPNTCYTPAEMDVGRFACNTEAQLSTMIDKTLQAEADQSGQAWRRRAIFMADDDFSYGYSDDPGSVPLTRDGLEARFEQSEDSLAARWDRFAGGAQTPDRFFLSTYLNPHFDPGADQRDLTLAKQYTASEAVPALLSHLTQGALLVHFQGHANAKLLCHEILFQDIRQGVPTPFTRRDVDGLGNTGKPGLFVGLGCHITEWTQNTADHSDFEPASLGEKVITLAPGGACASYGSSGFEFLISNADFGEVQLDTWLFHPPRLAGGGRTGWRMGDLLLAAEAATLARYAGGYDIEYRALAAQYCLLGDPLVLLDCGPPTLAATLTDAGGAPVTEGMELAALDATNVRHIRLAATDESGVDRVVVLDSAGGDLSSAVTELAPPDAGTNQRALYDVALPVRPFDHTVTLHVYDTSDRTPADNHATLTVRLPQSAAIYLSGSSDPIVPGEVRFALGVPLAFTAVVTTAAQLPAGAALQLTASGLTLTNVTLARRNATTLDLAFSATATDASTADRTVTLTVDGYPTTYVLQRGDGPVGGYALGDVLAFPNPAPGAVRIMFRTTAPAAPGRVQLYTVSGRRVATLRFGADQVQDGDGLVTWDGRDGEGDGVANGVYLYRVELDAPGGGLHSGMQRLVVMR